MLFVNMEVACMCIDSSNQLDARVKYTFLELLLIEDIQTSCTKAFDVSHMQGADRVGTFALLLPSNILHCQNITQNHSNIHGPMGFKLLSTVSPDFYGMSSVVGAWKT